MSLSRWVRTVAVAATAMLLVSGCSSLIPGPPVPGGVPPPAGDPVPAIDTNVAGRPADQIRATVETNPPAYALPLPGDPVPETAPPTEATP